MVLQACDQEALELPSNKYFQEVKGVKAKEQTACYVQDNKNIQFVKS